MNGTNSVTEKVENKKEDIVESKSVKSTEVSSETQTKPAPLPKENKTVDTDNKETKTDKSEVVENEDTNEYQPIVVLPPSLLE